MKIDPGFLDHWKTELLIESLGPAGVVAVMRLWGRAQIDRKWNGLDLNPKRLAIKTKWKADENLLWSILTDTDAPWLDEAEDGTWSIHGFDEHQKQVIHLWEAGKRGGRPKGKKPTPKKGKTYTSPSSSSYPISKSNGNHMVLEPTKQGLCTEEEVRTFSTSIGLTDADAQYIYLNWEENEWMNTKTKKPIKCWKRTIRKWKAGGFFPSQKADGGKQRQTLTEAGELHVD